jgi:Protease inhibitor Inh
MMRSRHASALVLLFATLLAGCWTTDRPAVENEANAVPAVAPPPTSLSGKWTLSATGAGSCTMTFGAQPQASEGTIAPAGGCPYSFFTSRKWNYTTAGLIIRDHNAQQLAQLSPTGDGRFEGKTNAGQDVALSR